MIEVAHIIIYINEHPTLSNSLAYTLIKESITSYIQEEFSRTHVYQDIRLSYYNQGKDEIGIIIYITFEGIYQSYVNYKYIYKIINDIVDNSKNRDIIHENCFILCRIAVKSYTIIKPQAIITQLEIYAASIATNTKDSFYDITIDVEVLKKEINTRLAENELFLKLHRTTKFHDIDIKMWEARKALSLGLSITSIVMIGVILEECLKTVLKSNHEQKYRMTAKGATLDILKEGSLSAEKKYGNMQLYPLINSLFDENFVDEEERKHLIHIKDFIRNAFIHSDKSKIFDTSKKGNVDVIKLVRNRLVLVETTELSIIEMSFAQGMLQKKLADDNAKVIFYEIEDFIIRITDRFWNKWKSHNEV